MARVKLDKYIQLCDERNGKQVRLDNLKGISIQKKFIESKADIDGVPLSSYLVVKSEYALKFITGNLGVNGTKITMPLYMAMFI